MLLARIASPSAVSRPVTVPFSTIKIFHHAFAQCQVRGGFQCLPHRAAVQVFVTLGANRLHGGAFASVQHSDMGQRRVGVEAHLAAECVNFAHQMAFGRAADGAVAGHQCYFVERKCEAKRGRAHPRRGEGGLRAGMAGANYYHIIVVSHNLDGAARDTRRVKEQQLFRARFLVVPFKFQVGE